MHFVHLMDGRLVIEVGKEKLAVPASAAGGIGTGAVTKVLVDADHAMDTAEEDEDADLSYQQTQPVTSNRE